MEASGVEADRSLMWKAVISCRKKLLCVTSKQLVRWCCSVVLRLWWWPRELVICCATSVAFVHKIERLGYELPTNIRSYGDPKRLGYLTLCQKMNCPWSKLFHMLVHDFSPAGILILFSINMRASCSTYTCLHLHTF